MKESYFDKESIPVILCDNFINHLNSELIALVVYLDESFDKEGFHLIDRGYQFNFSKFKPRKKITKKIYKELLLIYSICWMMEFQEKYLKDVPNKIDQAIFGGVIFHAYLTDRDINMDEEKFLLYHGLVKKVVMENTNPELIPTMRILAEYAESGNMKAGSTLIRVLHFHMNFEKLIAAY